MSNLVKATQKHIVSSNSVSGAAGKGMVVAGAGGIGLWFLAGLIPFVSLPVLCVILVIAGVLLAE